MEQKLDNKLHKDALEYHAREPSGKLAIVATKQLTNQYDLALAYSPGVAAACNAIVDDINNVGKYTARNNLVGVITNGTAVLGLGNIGPYAAKPVMEGKAVLFKKFANIDVFDIEVDALDPKKFIEAVSTLEPTFGAINLEDIKAPECFMIEEELQKRMKIPVFHDDQHGTAITVCAAMFNALRLAGKKIEEVKLVSSGAGAAALSCIRLLEKIGLQRKNITLTDIKGVVYTGRVEEMDEYKGVYAIDTAKRTLAEVIDGADVFLGLSAANVLKPEMVAKMAKSPIIFALANPTPEILPELVHQTRNDAIMATGRSDYVNQVNNVLCFPFIFRGALDVGATCINDQMKIAAIRAIADLATETSDERLQNAYKGQTLSFSKEYIIPKPFDPRLMARVSPAVAKAAMDSGVATRPIADFNVYQEKLTRFTLRTSAVMKPIYDVAKYSQSKNRIVFCEGENEKVLRAVQIVVNEQIAKPILIGRPEVIASRLEKFDIKLEAGKDFNIVNPNQDERFHKYWNTYYQIMQRKGVSQEQAKLDVRRHNSIIGMLMLKLGDADGVICGTIGRFRNSVDRLMPLIDKCEGVTTLASMSLLILPNNNLFVCDPFINYDPSAEQIAEYTALAAKEVESFGIPAKIALLSNSSFGSANNPSAIKMRQVLSIVQSKYPNLEIDGEMQADAAISETLRQDLYPFAKLKGQANLLIFPNVDSANIAFNLLKTLSGEGLTVGPILLGTKQPLQVLNPTASVRRIVNMTALIVAKAQKID